MKKRLLALLGFASPVAVFADGTTPMDTVITAVNTEVTAWSTAITGFFTTNIPTILGIVGVALAITLAWVAFKLFKRGTSKAG